MNRVLPKEFFARNGKVVAKELLGKYLTVQHRDKEEARMIVETESYHGPYDKASHAFRGQTTRNAPMFGPPGHWYVYLVYGMHEMLNVVTGDHGYPSAVLIRAVERANGPGKLTKTLGISRSINTLPADKKTGTWIEDRGVQMRSTDIERASRIGVNYAQEWKDRELRFVIKHAV